MNDARPRCRTATSSAEPVEPKGLANLLLDWFDADKIPVSPMKLQKMVFFCHADLLASTGKCLIKHDFEAWDYGPVLPSLYSEFKRFGDRPISARAHFFNPVTASRQLAVCQLDADTEAYVRGTYLFYRRLTAGFLSELSHTRGGPWRHARAMFANGLNMDRRISDEMIQRFHTPAHEE